MVEFLWGALKWSWITIIIPLVWWIGKRYSDDFESLRKGQGELKAAMQLLEKKLAGEHMTREQTEALVGKTEQGIVDLHRKIESTGQDLGEKVDANHRQVMNALLALNRGI